MKEDLLSIIRDSITDEEIQEVVKGEYLKALRNTFNSSFMWGELKKAIEKKIKEVLVPYIEEYDFNSFIPKLDTVLTEIINSENCLLDKKILENFSALCTPPYDDKITVSELFKEWIAMCNYYIDTTNLETEEDDYGEKQYVPVTCFCEVTEEDSPSWSIMSNRRIIFYCNEDENLNVEIHIYKYKTDASYTISCLNSRRREITISSLRTLNSFDTLLMRLQRARTPIEIDKSYIKGEIEPDDTPE